MGCRSPSELSRTTPLLPRIMPPSLTEPLRFERRLLEKVWGGRALERCLGFALPPDVPVGETWEVVDREDVSSVVAEGEHEGRTLHELMREHGPDLLGTAPAGKGGRFPLLVKYIDASQDLSVQVHPDDETARRLGGGAEGKTEAWYVVDVAEGGRLYAGLKPEVTREGFTKIAAGPEVEQALLEWSVRPGDCLLVPGGTVHAIGAGVTILEVQQNSDTTYRLYDWGRLGLDGKPRDTHVDRALPCIRFGVEPRPPSPPRWEEASPTLRTAAMARSEFFTMTALGVSGATRFVTAGSYRILAVIAGSGELVVSASGRRYHLDRGDVWLVPAACGEHRLEPDDCELRLVLMT